MSNITAYYIPTHNNVNQQVRLLEESDIRMISSEKLGVDLWAIEKKFIAKEPVLTFDSSIYREGFLIRLNKMGYYKRYSQTDDHFFIKVTDNIIKEVQVSDIKDDFYSNHIQNLEALQVEWQGLSLTIRPEELSETYLNQSHLIFNDKFLAHLPTHNIPFLRDTKIKSYFPYKNCVLEVNKEGIKHIPYSEINDRCIWEDQIIPHKLTQTPDSECHFQKFVYNVSNNSSDRISAMKSSIGYLLHNNFNPTKGQVVIAYDEAVSKRGQPEGGTGKGILANALKQLRRTKKIDGKNFDNDDRFKWQSIDRQTQVVWLDDINSKFSFEVLYSSATDGWNIEAKYQPEFYIPPKDSPKVLITSNKVLDNRGTTNKRRQFILEFSDHYSRHIKNGTEEPIIKEHGCTFFDEDDWDESEWNSFFHFMFTCVQFYLKNGLIPYKLKNVNQNLLVQETSDEFVEWISSQNIELNKKYITDDLYNQFVGAYNLNGEIFTRHSFSKFLKAWAKSNDWAADFNRSNGKSILTLNSL